MTVDYARLKEDDAYFEVLGGGLWLMDDHRWALIAWEQAAVVAETPYVLVHADYHWDGCYDAHECPAKEALLVQADVPALFELVKAADWIRYDSFIAPAIVRRLVDEVHYYCKQQDHYDIGIDDDLLRRFAAFQQFHETPESLALVAPGRPLIFDLCLDLFNRPDKNDKMYEGVLWSDDEVMAFLGHVKELVQRARIVTVSLSFGYSGTVADTRHLAQQAWRRELESHAAQ